MIKHCTNSTCCHSSVLRCHSRKQLPPIHSQTVLHFIPATSSPRPYSPEPLWRQLGVNPFIAIMSLEKRPIKERNLKPFSLFVFFFCTTGKWKDLHPKTHSINNNSNNNNNILYSSQREIKAVVRSCTLTHNEELNFTYLNNSKSWNTYTYTLSDIHPLKLDVLKDRKIYWTQASPCICQPGNVTGWGSEGVKEI